MVISTKYDIGQELFGIASSETYKTCPHCGNLDVDELLEKRKIRWGLRTCTEVERIKICETGIIYDTAIGIGVSEAFINSKDKWFTTRKQAQSECDRRNAELKGEQ